MGIKKARGALKGTTAIEAFRRVELPLQYIKYLQESLIAISSLLRTDKEEV